jgi:hypothetical protein
MINWKRTFATFSLLLLVVAGAVAQTAPVDGIDARADTAELGRQLANPDPLVRQKAAEAIAQLAATDQRKLIEGYYLQEKNKNVRLALEWASYRTGKQDALYRVTIRRLGTYRSWTLRICFTRISNAIAISLQCWLG